MQVIYRGVRRNSSMYFGGFQEEIHPYWGKQWQLQLLVGQLKPDWSSVLRKLMLEDSAIREDVQVGHVRGAGARCIHALGLVEVQLILPAAFCQSWFGGQSWGRWLILPGWWVNLAIGASPPNPSALWRGRALPHHRGIIACPALGLLLTWWPG